MRVVSNWQLILNMLVGTAIFISGFLPFAPSSELNVADASNESTVIRPRVGRTVLIVIDAFRWDFFHPLNSTRLVQTRKLVEEMGFFKEARAASPTVTLPRIKAIVSGSVPGFADVVVNLDSGAMDRDSFVRRAKLAGRILVFYGDDTWLRLFPPDRNGDGRERGGVFSRSDGTASFYVNDWTEVDDNVTRHLDDELSRADWDLMVLHYLGLDHVGHTLGPASPVIRTKLTEMDDVVDRVVTALVRDFDAGKASLPPLVVVCGDHGMSDGGSHGGSSTHETQTPLIFISPLYSRPGPGFGWSETLRSGRVEEEEEQDQSVEQVDLATTLSALLGLKIPSSSVGRLISDSVRPLDPDARLDLLRKNHEHLLSLCEVAGVAMDSCRVPGDDSAATYETLDAGVRCLQEALLRVIAEYDVYRMFLGSVLAVLTCAAVTLKMMSLESFWAESRPPPPPPPSSSSAPLSGASVLAVKCAMATFCWSFVSFRVCRWVAAFSSSDLCPPHESRAAAWVGVVAWTFLGSTFLDCVLTAAATTATDTREPKRRVVVNWNLAFLALPVIQAVTAASSSFVEEEHYTWYHLATTLTVALVVRNVLDSLFGARRRPPLHASVSCASSSPRRGMSDDPAAAAAGAAAGQCPTDVDACRHRRRRLGRDLYTGLALLAVLRLVRAWNQTGEKWAHLDDAGKFLDDPARSGRLPLLGLVAGLAGVLWLALWSPSSSDESPLVKALVASCLPAVYVFHAGGSGIGNRAGLPLGSLRSARGKTEARFVFLLTGVGCFGAFADFAAKWRDPRLRPSASPRLWSKLRLYLVVVAALTGKTHNVPLLGLVCLLQELYFASAVGPGPGADDAPPPSSSSLVAHWVGAYVMGMASFFAQGNSNSLATVHLASGYVGLDSHSLLLAGPILVLSTYSYFLLWILRAGVELSPWLALAYVPDSAAAAANSPFFDAHRLARRSKDAFLLAVLWARGLPSAFYMLVLCGVREHLFVWSVFAPKLLYDAVSTLICVALCVLVSL